MKSVFSCSFDVTLPKQSAQAAFQRASELTQSWICDKYARPIGKPAYGFGHPITLPSAPGEVNPLAGHLIRRDDQSCAIGEIRSFLWEHPGDEHEPDEFWSTQVVLAHDGNCACVTVHTRVGSRRYTLRPLSFTPGIPGLVRELLRHLSCSLGGWPMPGGHYPVPQGRVEQFVQACLCASDRTLPVVVISRDVWTEKTSIEPARWARSLVGLAEIAVLENKWAAFQLTDHVGKALSCFNAAVRIYWPGFNPLAIPGQHRLWLPHEIEAAQQSAAPLERRLLGHLCAISATNHVDSVLVSKIRRAIDDQRSAERTAAIAAASESAKAPEDFNALIELYSVEQKALVADKASLQAELETVRAACEEARREIETHRENYLALSTGQPGSVPESGSGQETEPSGYEFASVLEAFDAAKTAFEYAGSPLVFLESARKSATDSPYKSPEEVYFLIEALHDTAKRWRAGKGTLGMTWEAALKPTGFDYANKISQTTLGNFGADYHFQYEGQSRLFAQHVTKGAKTKNACFSIHMYRDEKRLLLVIGHCGNHLPNTTT